MVETKVKVEHEGSDIGAVAGGVVTGTTTAGLTFAGASHVASKLNATTNPWQALQQTAGEAMNGVGDGLKGAGDFVKNNLSNAKNAAKNVKDAAATVNPSDAGEALTNPEVAENLKKGANQIKDKAADAFGALKGSAKELWNKFDGIENPKVKAAILASTVVVPILATAIATNAMKPQTEVEVKTRDTQIESQSQAASRSQASQLAFG
jgi:hypothetical protein